MLLELLNLISRCIPKKCFHKNHGVRNGEKYFFTENQNRERWVESTYDRIVHKLKKYSFMELKNKIWYHKSHKKCCYLIGKITLGHAALEKEVRALLLIHFSSALKDLKSKNGMYKSSGSLRTYLDRCIKSQNEKDAVFVELSQWSQDFEELSKKRNKAVKSIYSLNVEERTLSRVNPELHAEMMMMQRPIDQNWIESWIEGSSFDDLTAIDKELRSLWQRLLNIKCKLINRIGLSL